MIEQLPLLGGGAGLAVFAAVIFYLLRANAIYRSDNRLDNDRWQARYNAEVEAARLRLESEIKAHERTQEMLDAERERRREAENGVWKVARELRSEMTQLRKTVAGDADNDPR